MDAMVLQLDSNSRAGASPLELFAAWKGRVADGALIVHPPGSVSISATAARSAAAASVDAASVPRCASADPRFNALMEGRLCVLLGQEYQKDRGSAAGAAKSSRVTATASTRTINESRRNGAGHGTGSNTFRFTRPREGMTFQLPDRARTAVATGSSLSPLKRRRHGLDVDGPNTAGLCCKKRRLRTKLITSRLSQPYSQPATHILNREGQKQGDKRFLKMATAVDVARRHAHPHAQSTSFFKYSVMNRLRQRLGLGRPTVREAHGTHDDDAAADGDANLDTTTKAPWKTADANQRHPNRPLHRPTPLANAMTTTTTATITRTPLGSGTPPRRQSARFSKPAALPLPPSDLAAAKVRTSPRIHAVRSPELRPDKTIGLTSYEDLEEDGFAFLHGDEENLNDLTDDPDHVYSDFGLIFGGGGSDDGGNASGNGGGGTAEDDDYSYEEYLDELDGISWVTM